MANALSFAESQDVPLRDPIFVMTLPFDQDPVKRYLTDRILSRTKRRWEWFAEAQKSSSQLGTLFYLPPEVRRLIWKKLFYCRDTLSSDGIWEYECTLGPIFDLSAYYFGFGRRGLIGFNGFTELRLVSSTVKAESDDIFLSFRTFRFNQAQNLTGFLKQLTPSLSDRLLSVEFGICLPYSMDPWMAPLPQLPFGLRELRFRIYRVKLGWFDFDQSWSHLGKLIERAAEVAPNAWITITSTDKQPLSPECQVATDAILERLREQKRLKANPS